MIVIKLYELHFVVALCTLEWVIAKRQKDVLTPFRKRFHQAMLGFGDSFPKGFILFAVPGIEPIVTGHFKVFFRDVLNQELYKIYDRKSPFYKGIVFMAVIVKGDVAAVIGINPIQGNDRASEIAADIFNHRIGIAEIGFGIDIKAILILAVDKSLGCFERGPNMGLKEIEESGLERFAKESIVEMFDNSPGTIIRESPLCNEAVDMRIPLQRPAKCMKDTDKARNKVS